jgi:phosphoglycerate dehydrogenase-like enzyme
MTVYWTLNHIPELAPLAPEQRRRVWRVARRKLSRSWTFWGFGLVGGGVATFLSALALPIIPWAVHLVVAGAILGAFLLVWQQMAFAQARPYLREALAGEATDR